MISINPENVDEPRQRKRTSGVRRRRRREHANRRGGDRDDQGVLVPARKLVSRKSIANCSPVKGTGQKTEDIAVIWTSILKADTIAK